METKELEKEFLMMIEAQKRTIYKVCYIYANDQDDLNDLYQETVLNLWKSFPRYRGDSKLATWVYRIAMNTCITFLRRSNTRPQTVPMTANVASMAAEDQVCIRPYRGTEYLQLRGEYAHHLRGIPVCLYEYTHPSHLICYR